MLTWVRSTHGKRELREELGIVRVPRRPLVQDWAPSDAEGDKILYVFSCGDPGADAAAIMGSLNGRSRPHFVVAKYCLPQDLPT